MGKPRLEILEDRTVPTLFTLDPWEPPGSTAFWRDTGVDVAAGQTLKIVTTGFVSDGFHGYNDADGVGGGLNGTETDAGAVYPGAIFDSLIGKVGGTTLWNTGTPVPEGKPGEGAGFVGTFYQQMIPVSGRLFLSYNDQWWAFTDNYGSFQADITIIGSDIAMQSAQLQSGNTVQFTYATTGNPGPFQVGLYRSTDGITYNPADLIATQTVTPSPTNPQTPGTFTLPSPWMPDPGKPYLLVVADPSNAIIESNEDNNTAAVLLPDVIVQVLPVGNPIMGSDYALRVNVANNTAGAVTLTLGCEEKYISVVNWKEPHPKSPVSITVTLVPGEARIVTLGTFNHSWEWLPKNPPTIPSDLANQLYSQVASGLGGLLSQLLGIIGKTKTKDVMEVISSWSASLNTQLDIASLLQQVYPTAQVNYTVRVTYSYGRVAFSETVPVEITVSQEQLNHLYKHLVYFVLADSFRTGIPALDFVLEDAFRRLAKDEYKAAEHAS